MGKWSEPIGPLTALSSVLGWLRGVNHPAAQCRLRTANHRCMAPGRHKLFRSGSSLGSCRTARIWSSPQSRSSFDMINRNVPAGSTRSSVFPFRTHPASSVPHGGAMAARFGSMPIRAPLRRTSTRAGRAARRQTHSSRLRPSALASPRPTTTRSTGKRAMAQASGLPPNVLP